MTSCRRLCNRFSPSCITICVVSFLAFVVALILLRLFHKRFLEIDDVIGAFAGYMIVAVLWGKSVRPNHLLVPRLIQHRSENCMAAAGMARAARAVRLFQLRHYLRCWLW